MPASQTEKANRFRALHAGPGSFVIGNAWDAGSARILPASGSLHWRRRAVRRRACSVGATG